MRPSSNDLLVSLDRAGRVRLPPSTLLLCMARPHAAGR